jgi:hypothetical protein
MGPKNFYILRPKLLFKNTNVREVKNGSTNQTVLKTFRRWCVCRKVNYEYYSSSSLEGWLAIASGLSARRKIVALPVHLSLLHCWAVGEDYRKLDCKARIYISNSGSSMGLSLVFKKPVEFISAGNDLLMCMTTLWVRLC